MKPLQLLFLSFLIIPFIEIYVLLEVGGLIGAFPTILLVVFSAVLGAKLLKSQGFATWQRLQDSLQQGKIPAYEMIEGPIILVGGALLLTPGFFTDLLGFACLIPALRRKLADYIIQHFLQNAQAESYTTNTSQQTIIEGEFERKDQ